jgi:hypothetical protein
MRQRATLSPPAISHKVTIRDGGPTLFRKIAELRNAKKHGNEVGLGYEAMLAKASSDEAIVAGIGRTSKGFDWIGPTLKVVGAGGTILVSGLLVDSPAGLSPLPQSPTTELETEATRLRLSIPAEANIDVHGHLKPGFYLQIDPLDPHVGDELAAETDEILWFLGIDITYQYYGVRWTVPGR